MSPAMKSLKMDIKMVRTNNIIYDINYIIIETFEVVVVERGWLLELIGKRRTLRVSHTVQYQRGLWDQTFSRSQFPNGVSDF